MRIFKTFFVAVSYFMKTPNMSSLSEVTRRQSETEYVRLHKWPTLRRPTYGGTKSGTTITQPAPRARGDNRQRQGCSSWLQLCSACRGCRAACSAWASLSAAPPCGCLEAGSLAGWLEFEFSLITILLERIFTDCAVVACSFCCFELSVEAVFRCCLNINCKYITYSLY